MTVWLTPNYLRRNIVMQHLFTIHTKINYKKLINHCLVGFFLFISSCGYGQSANVLSGVILDSSTHLPMSFVSVTNITARQTTLSNNEGHFSIKAKPSDIISFAAVSYTYDTVIVNIEKLASIYFRVCLLPIEYNLESVTIRNSRKYTAYQLDSLERRNDFFLGRSSHSIPTVSNGNSGAGIGFNIDHFYGREKRKRKAIELFEKMELEHYINYRFSPQMVGKFVRLSSDSLLLFTQRYRPSTEWLRKNNSEESLIYYINDNIKVFLGR